MNGRCEEEVPLNWARRGGRPAKLKPTAVPALPRIPRITRLMALASKFQDMVDRGEVRDYADLARLGYVTRARVTQIMNLLLLAPELQENLLLLPLSESGSPPAERGIRVLCAMTEWERQRAAWRCLSSTA